MTFIFSPSYMHYSYAGIQPCSVLSTIVTSTILQNIEPTSRSSMTPGEGSQQDDCSGTIAAVVTMGVLNIIFIAIFVTLMVALMRSRKKQVQGSAGVQRRSTIGLFHLMSLPPSQMNSLWQILAKHVNPLHSTIVLECTPWTIILRILHPVLISSWTYIMVHSDSPDKI